MRIPRSAWLLLLLAVLVVVPLLKGGEFGGSDGEASVAIEQANPGFTPWLDPLWEPPSGEIESLLFALQAALGALVIGYVVGRRHGQSRARADRTGSGRPAQSAG